MNDSIYSTVIPTGDNHYFSGYKFSKKYGFVEFRYRYYRKGELLRTTCKCDTLKKTPLFNE